MMRKIFSFENKKLSVPYEVISETQTNPLLTTLYLYLRIEAGMHGRVYTSLTRLLQGCGYNYNTHSATRGYLALVKDGLQWLQDNDFVGYYEDAVTNDQRRELESNGGLKPNTHFIVCLTDNCIDCPDQFVSITVAEYATLYGITAKYKAPVYRNACNLFFYLMKHQQTKNQRTLTYYAGTIQKLADNIPGGLSEASISDLLQLLESLALIHKTTTSTLRLDNGNAIYGFTVVVAHSDNWEQQLYNAKYIVTEKQREKYIKQGLLTE